MLACFGTNQRFCRVCMGQFDSKIDFGNNLLSILSDDECLTFLDCFEFVTRIKIDLTTNFQQHLCSACTEELKNAFKFIRKAEEAEQRHRESIDENLHVKEDDENVELSIYDLIEETSDKISLDTFLGERDSVLDSQSFCNELDLETPRNIAEIDIPINDEIISSVSWIEESAENCVEDKETQEIKSEIVQNFHCQECNKNFKNQRSLYLHRYRFHQNSNFYMDIHGELQTYSRHNSQKKLRCKQCSKTYKTLPLLKTHLKYHERKKMSKKSDACPICGKQFATAYYLRQHTELVHADERIQLACDKCNKIYLTKNALEIHKRIHTGKTIDCEKCGKSFVNSYELKIHLRFHQRDYSFECKICDKKFVIKGHLRTHMFQHQGLKLQCEDCKKLFTSTKALLEHSFTHAEAMPFPCCYCNKSYPSKHKYKVHLKTVHLVELNEIEHITALNTSKLTLRNRNITLVHADNVNKEM